MTPSRLLNTLAQVNIALQQPHLYSAEQLKVFRKTRARLNKQLHQFTYPAAPARPLPAQLRIKL
jgi:hypothetical protein